MNVILKQRIDWCWKKGVRIGQNAHELQAVFYEMDSMCASTIVEIGTMAGGNLYCLAGACHFPPLRAIAVDDQTWHDSDAYSKKLGGVTRQLQKDGFDAVIYAGDSHGKVTKAWVAAYLGGQPIDVLYIDGDHTYAGCKADVNDYAPLVRDGGLIVLHDVASEEHADVARVWREIVDAGHWTRLCKGDPKHQLPGKKKKNVTGVGFVRKRGELVL